MAAPDDRFLVEALKLDAQAAWGMLKGTYPRERIYAFGIFVTINAEFVPMACGEDALAQVAEKYVDARDYMSLDEAAAALRWSLSDSSHSHRLKKLGKETAQVIRKRPKVDDQLGPTADKEFRARMRVAVKALKELDAEGLFGSAIARKKIVLLFATQYEGDWAMKLTKEVNPPDVYNAYKQSLKLPVTIGKFTELGDQKVYTTSHLAISADRKLVVTASEYRAFLFDLVKMKQHWGKWAPDRKNYEHIWAIAMSGDGSAIAAVAGPETNSALTVWSGKNWGQTVSVSLPAQGIALAFDPAGQWIAVGLGYSTKRGLGQTVWIYDPIGNPMVELKGHTGWPRSLAISPDGKTLVTADGKAVRLWNTRDWTLTGTIKGPAEAISFHPTGRQLAVAIETRFSGKPECNMIRILQIPGGKLVRDFPVPGYACNKAVFSADGKRLICAIQKTEEICPQQAVMLEIKSGRVLHRLQANFEAVEDLIDLPARKEIAVGVFGHTRKPLVLWQVG